MATDTGDRPERDELLMQHAQLAGMRGTCSRGRVGVVIAQASRIISTGYNGSPSGLPHCEHILCGKSVLTLVAGGSEHGGTSQTTPCGRPIRHEGDCAEFPTQEDKQSACTASVHAEANAIAFAARHGVSVEGATLYTTVSPCLACAQLIVNSGVLRVVIAREYRDPAGLDLLRAANVAVDKIIAVVIE